MTEEEMKTKYSAFVTEVSEILGLGKPIDILKLCATTDLFFQPLEKRIAELEAQIEKMKNCKNCKKLKKEKDGLLICTVGSFYTNVFGKHCDKWEIKEK